LCTNAEWICCKAATFRGRRDRPRAEHRPTSTCFSQLTNELATPERVSDIGGPKRRIRDMSEQRIVNVADIPLADNGDGDG
jgi:hypothetical protein